MWTRKSDEAIKNLLQEKARERKSLKRPLIYAFIFTVVGMILFSFGIRGARAYIYLTSPNSLFELKNIFAGAFLFAFLFSLMYLHQRRGFSILGSDESFLCSDCKEPYLIDTGNPCPCGGRLEPSDYFSWEG
ncbi:MAG TPA: hypothetical protein VK400_06455 [Pyrinomonadaceae bacterium]|nr:hypothetical protein [Pyrinomonadaceae bacterium]